MTASFVQPINQAKGRLATDVTRVKLVEWSNCQSGARLLLYRVAGGGHQLPSTLSTNLMAEAKFGLRNHDIETAEELWSYFKGYMR